MTPQQTQSLDHAARMIGNEIDVERELRNAVRNSDAVDRAIRGQLAYQRAFVEAMDAGLGLMMGKGGGA